MIKVNPKAIPEDRAGKFSRHLFIDVEMRGNRAMLIVRGEDHRLGIDASGGRHIATWNRIDGEAHEHVLASCPARQASRLRAAAKSLIEFFDDPAPLPERLSVFLAVNSCERVKMLAILLAAFPASNYQRGNSSRYRVGSYATRNLKRFRGAAAMELQAA